jgi:phosphatidate cytidylyltransferase
MSNIIQRLFLFFLGIPLVIALVVFLPQFNHGAVVLMIVVFVGGCAFELSRLFTARGIAANPGLFIVIGAGLPAGAYVGRLYLGRLLGGESALIGACLGMVLAAGIVLFAFFARLAFVRPTGISDVLPRAAALGFAAIYPGLLGAIIVLIASEPRYATESLLTFCILAFSNDSLAWLVGITIGRRRGIVAVSPNKSIAGFIGGMCGSVGTAFGCAAIFPSAIGAASWTVFVFGLVVGAAAIVGDLFESALKRSAGIKDSGSTVPGRGGFLDTFDSILFAAPVFYSLSLLLGYFR